MKRLCPFADLHAFAQTKHQMQSRLLLDVVVGQSRAVLELLAREDESLLVKLIAILVLTFLLHDLDTSEYGTP